MNRIYRSNKWTKNRVHFKENVVHFPPRDCPPGAESLSAKSANKSGRGYLVPPVDTNMLETSLEFPPDPKRDKGYSTTWEQGTLMSARQLTQQVRRNAVISTCTLAWGYTRAKNMGTGGKSIRVVYDIRKNCRFLSCQSAELTTTLLRHLLAHYYAVIMLRRGLP